MTLTKAQFSVLRARRTAGGTAYQQLSGPGGWAGRLSYMQPDNQVNGNQPRPEESEMCPA